MGTFTVDALDELLQPKNHEDRTFCSVLDLKQHIAESDRPQVFSTYIKKGKGNRYPDSFFAREPDRAKDLIRETEDAYEPLRKRVVFLTTLRKRLNEYVRM